MPSLSPRNVLCNNCLKLWRIGMSCSITIVTHKLISRNNVGCQDSGVRFPVYRTLSANIRQSEPPRDKNNKMACAPSEDSDQPGHLPSLIRVFAVRMRKAWVLKYPLSAQRKLWSDLADAQADLSLRWAHSHFFVLSCRGSSHKDNPTKLEFLHYVSRYKLLHIYKHQLHKTTSHSHLNTNQFSSLTWRQCPPLRRTWTRKYVDLKWLRTRFSGVNWFQNQNSVFPGWTVWKAGWALPLSAGLFPLLC